MNRNLEGLKLNAQARSDGALSRATATIRQMQADDLEINFRSVAGQAKVSTAWLYRNKDLRDRIIKLRHTSPAVAAKPHNSVSASRMNVSSLHYAFRIKMLEETNRELSEKLEAAYGRLALPSSARRLHGNDVRP